MKTLVIHPKDETTDFLAEIYSDKDWMIITDNISKEVLEEQIKAHDRIVMLGHGSDLGLFGHNGFMIDAQWAYLLKEKSCVCIWCHADKFVEKKGLKGFYTGMFISEIEEAYVEDIFPMDDDEVKISNNTFVSAVKNYIDTADMLEQVMKHYNDESNEVIKFNRTRLFNSSNL